jgi:hypothetical protein
MYQDHNGASNIIKNQAPLNSYPKRITPRHCTKASRPEKYTI